MPETEEEVLAVLANLAEFQNKFENFSVEEINESYEEFLAAFNYTEENDFKCRFTQIPSNDPNILKYTEGNKFIEIIFAGE